MGQAKQRGTYEDRLAQAQNRYNNLPTVNLLQITPKTADSIINQFIEFNIDYLTTYRPRGRPSSINKKRATKLVKTHINTWIRHHASFVYGAFDYYNNMIGYVTVHESTSAEWHSGCKDRLIEDIYVAPKYRHQGYMTAIRKMTQSKQSLVDKVKLVENFDYYKKSGIKSFNILFYSQEQMDSLTPIMKGTVAVRYDNAGECEFTLENLNKTILKDQLQMNLFGLYYGFDFKKEPAQ
jgi:predicted acetyltransferase